MKGMNAGFDIIAHEVFYEDDELEYGYAVGKKHHQYGTEYVTWEFKKVNGTYDFYWGHYFNDRDAAFRDYHSRLFIEYKEE